MSRRHQDRELDVFERWATSSNMYDRLRAASDERATKILPLRLVLRLAEDDPNVRHALEENRSAQRRLRSLARVATA